MLCLGIIIAESGKKKKKKKMFSCRRWWGGLPKKRDNNEPMIKKHVKIDCRISMSVDKVKKHGRSYEE